MRNSSTKYFSAAMIAVISFVTLLLVSLTVAYLTDARSVLNVLNIGSNSSGQNSVQIALIERNFGAIPNADVVLTPGGIAGEYDKVVLYDLLPGDEVYKDSTIVNIGYAGVYVRFRLTDEDGKDIDANAAPYNSLEYSITNLWTEHADGFYYYTGSTPGTCKELERGEVAFVFMPRMGHDDLFYTIKIKDDVNNDVLKALEGKVDIKVIAEAIQAKNFIPGPLDGIDSPWGDEVIIAAGNRRLNSHYDE